MDTNIKMAKLVTGEVVVGKVNNEANVLEEVVVFQPTPPQQQQTQGQIMLLPYGYPFTQKLEAKISLNHVVMIYSEIIGDTKDRYLELLEKARLAGAIVQ